MVIRAGLFVAALAMLSAGGSASTVHEIRFVQSAQVLVWQGDVWVGQGSSVDLIGQEFIEAVPFPGSGLLDSVAPSDLPLTGRMRLKIASNSAFTIQTRRSNLTPEVEVRIVQVGPNARASGRVSEGAPGIVFHQAEKTAHRPGAPETQAIELELSWTGAAPSDMRVIASQ
ncbi:MAG: hypothetical protein AAGJ28_26270 [Pseudomonadota bacterium]